MKSKSTVTKTWRHEKKKKPKCAGLRKIRCAGKVCGLAEGIHQFIDRAVQVLVAPAESVDLVNRMEDRGVVLAAELPADFRKRRLGKLLDQVHRNLARKRDCFRIGAYFEVLLAQAELLADLFLNQVDGNPFFLRGDDVAQHLLRGGQI